MRWYNEEEIVESFMKMPVGYMESLLVAIQEDGE